MIIGLIVIFIALILAVIGITFDFEIGKLQQMKISIADYEGTLKELLRIGKWKIILILLMTILFTSVKIRLLEIILKVLNKINFNNPFSSEISIGISKIVSLSVFLGIASIIISSIADLLINKELSVSLDFGGSDLNFLIFSGIIYIVGEIYKRGLELQSENDLTI